MARSPGLLDILDGRPLVRASRVRLGPLRARGVPAILFGVAAIVFAAGIGEALKLGAMALPDSIREARLLLTVGRTRRELPAA